jgi:hypothetical protein
MQNLRILRVQVISSSSIEAVFTAPLSTTLITSNVSIIADASNVPNVEVLKISINNDTLTISCKPLTSFATYYILFQSVTGHPFTSLHGDAYLVQDGVANKYLITGPVEEDNPIQTYLKSYLSNNIYDSDNTNTIVGSYIGSLSLILSKALHDIKQSINENYLSFDVVDEIKTRSSGPFDRLNEEAAYEIIRVGRTSSQANAQLSYTNSAFNKDPITLQKQSTVEILTVDSSDIVGKFNINNLTLNLSNNQVTKITNLIFTLATIHPIYTYNIETLGYQITDSRYDTYYASDYVTLETNQIKLNDSILIDPLFSIHNIIRVEVAYEYKNLGRIVDATTLEVYTPLNSTREALPPIMNIFNLQHAPIVDSNNDIQTTGGITFVNPNNINQIHQAFLYEIPFRLNALPASIGQYSVDYETGTVYVYGADSTKDGTGPYPPLATYTYLYTYKSQLDYVYDTSLLEIVALPTGNLINYPGTISFYYEDVLVPDVDYKSALHIEVLNERIENRLVALNAFKTVNSPITNIFRIFNETTGEIYNLTRWNDNKVYFTYNTPPKVESIVNERTVFENIDNEMLFINTTITNFSALRVFKIFLKNSTIIAASEDGIGTSFNSSAIFSNTIAFVSEKWWNRDLSETTNIDKLLNVGEYCIDYTNGIVYCAVSATQSNDIGSISYKINSIVPTHTHLISVEDVFYRLSPLTVKNKSFTYSSFDEGSIVVDELEYSDELYLNNNNISVYQIYNKYIGTFVDSSFVSGVTNSIKFLRHVYEYEDLSYSTNPLNFEVSSTYNGTAIQVQPIVKQEFTAINYNIIDGYYVLINENIPYISSNIHIQ